MGSQGKTSMVGIWGQNFLSSVPVSLSTEYTMGTSGSQLVLCGWYPQYHLGYQGSKRGCWSESEGASVVGNVFSEHRSKMLRRINGRSVANPLHYVC